MTVSALGAVVGVIVALVAILKKVSPCYAMMFGALVGGIIGGAGLVDTTAFMIAGVKNVSSSIIRILTAGVLAGTLIETGAAKRIADFITEKIGAQRSLLAMMVATTLLTAVGVFGDVACLTVAPIAIQMAKKSGYNKLGVLMALVGGVKAGGAVAPNPDGIAAAEGFSQPLTSVMAAGILPMIAALIATGLISHHLAHQGSSFDDVDAEEDKIADKDLPGVLPAFLGPIVAIALLLLRPIAGITVDPLIALPLGGFVGALAMGKAAHFREYLVTGISKMSGVAILLVGTGSLAGIISNSNLSEVIIQAVDAVNLPVFLLAPISGALMAGATASAVAATTLASSIFAQTILDSGVNGLAAAAMTHVSVFVFDSLPQGPFFHVSAGSVGMSVKERLRLVGWESLNGLAMTVTATLLYGVLGILG